MSGSNHGIHTVWHQTHWANVKEGQDKPMSTHPTKEEAVERGRELARRAHVEHLIHGQTHEIQERHSYGNDPANRPG